MPAERRRPEAPESQGYPAAPETRADLEPYLAELAGLRPADADSMPTADEVDGAGELTDTGLTDERTTRVVEAVRANAETAGLVDQMSVESDGGRVILSGEVPDLDDEDAAMAVAAQASGTTAVVSRLAVAAVDEGGER